jgi:hypothetical protein
MFSLLFFENERVSSSNINGTSPHLANPMTGTPRASDSSATSPKVSKNLDGTSKKCEIARKE